MVVKGKKNQSKEKKMRRRRRTRRWRGGVAKGVTVKGRVGGGGGRVIA